MARDERDQRDLTPAATPHPDLVPEIGTRVIKTFFLYFEQCFGRERLLLAVARIGGAPDWAYIQDPENFVALEYLLRVALVLTEESGDPAFLRRAGEHQVDDARSLGFVYYVVRSLGSPRTYYTIAVRTASTFNRVGDVALEASSDRRVVFRYRSRKPEGNRLICEGRIGQLASAPRLWGLPLADVRELECQVLGAPACRYEITWIPIHRPLLLGLCGASAGLVAGALAFGPEGAVVGAMLCTLAALAASYRKLASSRAEHILDSTEAAERAMHELQRRFEQLQRAESALVEAQKLEAIGRLSGGIAHDFNNLLSVITAAADLAKRRVHSPQEALAQLEAISSASGRAADLTQRLLAFARRQVVEPRVVNVGRQLQDLHEMLRRLVGERIEVVLDVHPAVPDVLIDPTQLEQVLMNLAANARDAMPEGGTLRFEVRSRTLSTRDKGHADDVLRPGRYVVVAARDTGSGMDEATRRRAFEPFFTTKQLGRGTGLGLATCHGIAHQAGGTIAIESAPGTGTTILLHLPSVAEGT